MISQRSRFVSTETKAPSVVLPAGHCQSASSPACRSRLVLASRSRHMTTHSSMSFDAMQAPNLPPKNHVHISQPQNAIQGTWLLDTSIKLPRHISTHAADGSTRPHLKLEAFKGAIIAEVFLVARDWKPALMELSTHKGNISLRLVGRSGIV
jgi:hypothetical protein